MTDYEKELKALYETRSNLALENTLQDIIQENFRKLNVKRLMEQYEIVGGELVEINGKRYLMASFEVMWRENQYYDNVFLKAYALKKDGTPSKAITTIYSSKERIKRV